MNEEEAKDLLHAHLKDYRRRSYTELAALIGEPQTAELRGPSGKTYQLELQVFWDSRPGEALRVLASIDDGGLRAFVPLTDSFIMNAGGAIRG
jgi:hypothetical protein